jgi:hypothetical protein
MIYGRNFFYGCETAGLSLKENRQLVKFDATIKKFGQQGEKTGWTYIEIPPAIAGKIKPGEKVSFRVKGKLDNHPIEMTSLLPMGGGAFILPLNAEIRKAIRKNKGAVVHIQMAEDNRSPELSRELLLCLADEPAALKNFKKLPLSHQRYYSKWIESAKTAATKSNRIARTVNAMVKGLSYGEMLRQGDLPAE